MNDSYKYYAFISYNSKDTAWGKRLQKKLEHYRMPAALCNEHGWKRKPINPVFFAPTDIQPGGLSSELQERLKAAQHLVVICSPNSAKSEWVGREIEFFHNLGRTNNIHFFIVDGTPHSGDPATECFNPVIDKLGLPEILGANIHERVYRWSRLNRERAYVQLISKLLGVEFDAIWQRHKRQLTRKIAAWTIGSIAVLGILLAVWRMNRPVDVELRLNEASAHNENLPPLKDAIVTLSLDNETKTDTIADLSSSSVFTNIPRRFLDKPVHVTIACPDFLTTDTTMVLNQNITVDLYRDPTVYGDIRFRLWSLTNEDSMANTTVEIEGRQVLSDANGTVTLSLPIEAQRKTYKINAEIPLVTDSLFMPCGEDDVIMTE